MYVWVKRPDHRVHMYVGVGAALEENFFYGRFYLYVEGPFRSIFVALVGVLFSIISRAEGPLKTSFTLARFTL